MHDVGEDDAPKPKTLPGERASTVRVPSFINSMPRWILKMKGGLAGFLRSMLEFPSETKCSPISTASSLLWPMPVPFPEVFRRRRDCPHSDDWLKRLVSFQVILMSWTALGCPRRAPASIALGTRLRAKQWRVVRTLMGLNVDENTPQLVNASNMGRSASKFENVEDMLAALARAATVLQDEENAYFGGELRKPESEFQRPFRSGKPCGHVKKGQVISAKPLIAERLNFPGPPSFDPSRYLDHKTEQRYNYPLQLAQDHEAFEGEVPKVRVFADRKNKVELFRKLALSGRLEPLSKTLKRASFQSGLFAVGKDLTRDRLVLDGRPANALEMPQTLWCRGMASPTALNMLYLRPGHVLLCSGEDLRDYFYQFAVSDERTARNMLCEPVTPTEAAYIFGHQVDDDDGEVWVGLSSLAMGDSMACEFAQGSHLGLMLQHHVAFSDQLLSLHNPIPRGLHHVGVIIDDLIILEQILLSDLEDLRQHGHPTWGSATAAKARSAYALVGLETNPKKAFEDEVKATFWGVGVDGNKGLMRPAQTRLWPATFITMRVATLRLATVGLLEALAGIWVSLFGLRRRLFCLLDLIFEPLGMQDQRVVLRLSDAMVDELVSLVIMAPLAVINFRAEYAPFLVASDACLDGLAAVTTPLTSAFSEELCRHSLRKSAWSTLLPAGKSWRKLHDDLPAEEELEDHEYEVHPLWELCARACPFTTTWSVRVEKPLHINILEMRAHLREERRLAQRHCSLRIPCGLDSQVCLGACIKGRASATSLTKELRKGLGYGIGSDLHFFYMFFPSAMNRADGPSRFGLPKLPDLPLPQWWDSALLGDFAGLDAWLEASSPFTAYDSIPYEELMGPERRTLAPRGAKRIHAAKRRRLEKSEEAELAPYLLPKEPKNPLPQRAEAVEAVRPPETNVRAKPFAALLEKLPRCQFFPQDGPLDFNQQGALDLFSGSFGVAKELVRCGAPWVLTYELKRAPCENLLEKETQETIFTLLKLEAFLSVGMAPVCRSFSRAVTPAVRSAQYPRGLPVLTVVMRGRVTEGNLMADFLEEVIKLCNELLIAFWCENPDTSFLWFLKGWRLYRDSDTKHVFRCAFCRFGTPWRKNTRFATNTALKGVRMLCNCKHREHVRLRGYSRIHGTQWTKVAEPYPRGLCRLLARACAVKAGWLHKDKLNIAGCCRCSSLRIGEAENPGPRRAAGHFHDRGTLEAAPLLLPATLALQHRVLQAFFVWCRREIRSMRIEDVFNKVPELLAVLLRTYGDMMYQHGGALSNLRHLLLAAQRWKPSVKPYMQLPWEMVTRWEAQEPVKHRTPLPEAVVKAMCTLSWFHHWYGWSLATALSFYGGARVGEILKCSREDLLLPCDLAEEGHSPVFLRLRFFKSRFRTPASVQHLKICDETTCRLLHLVFRNLEKDQLLFETNPYQFRKRWNLMLELLDIPASAGLTPGGLRGGFAVMAYRNGRSVQDIMWSMRLRSQVTLESYLQETASLNALVGVIERLTSVGDRVHHACETIGTVEGFDEDGDFKVKMSNGKPAVWYAHKCIGSLPKKSLADQMLEELP
eukprot:s1777_g9.t1